MARCTAPVRGHIRGGGADCPACSGRYSRWGGGYSSFSQPSYSTPSYSPPSYSPSSSSGAGRSSGRVSRNSKPRWARASSAVWYSPAEVQELEPVRATVEKQASLDLKDIFLCHAWDDRQGAATRGSALQAPRETLEDLNPQIEGVVERHECSRPERGIRAGQPDGQVAVRVGDHHMAACLAGAIRDHRLQESPLSLLTPPPL